MLGIDVHFLPVGIYTVQCVVFLVVLKGKGNQATSTTGALFRRVRPKIQSGNVELLMLNVIFPNVSFY